MRAHVCAAEFLDIGVPGDYLRTSLLLARREAAATLCGLRARIHPTARLEDSILWDDVEVGARSTLRECIVTDGASVPNDTSWVGVSLRAAVGELAQGERQVGALAVASI